MNAIKDYAAFFLWAIGMALFYIITLCVMVILYLLILLPFVILCKILSIFNIVDPRWYTKMKFLKIKQLRRK